VRVSLDVRQSLRLFAPGYKRSEIYIFLNWYLIKKGNATFFMCTGLIVVSESVKGKNCIFRLGGLILKMDIPCSTKTFYPSKRLYGVTNQRVKFEGEVIEL
jgi:hypothetical protein